MRRMLGYAVVFVLVCPMIATMRVQANQAPAARDHVAWVADALKRMTTITPGMTRAQLLAVFTGEGGGLTRLRRTYVSRECLYFKVDVEFEAVGRPSPRDAAGRVTLVEDPADRIVSISRPYLEFATLD